MQDVDDTSLALGLGCGGMPLNSLSWLPQVEPSLTLGVSEEIYGSVAIRKSALEDTSCRPARKPSSPHSTISSSTANYITKEEKTAGGDEDADDEEAGIRKKLRLTKEQSALLEDKFKERSTLTPKQKQALANQLNLRPRQVEVWFQNRRARTKLKQKEIDFEFLKRCFETLKEENLRLHKELKALKLSPPRPPPLYMQLPAASAATLAMCPSCERNMAGAGTARNKEAAGAGGFTAAAKPSHLFNVITRSTAC